MKGLAGIRGIMRAILGFEYKKGVRVQKVAGDAGSRAMGASGGSIKCEAAQVRAESEHWAGLFRRGIQMRGHKREMRGVRLDGLGRAGPGGRPGPSPAEWASGSIRACACVQGRQRKAQNPQLTS